MKTSHLTQSQKQENLQLGLTDPEVIASRNLHGSNELEQKKKLNILQKIAHVFVAVDYGEYLFYFG